MNYAIDIDRAVDGEDQAMALSLAEQWVADAPEDAAAWSKLAHVHEMAEDFPQANIAASEALRTSPDYQPYLFEKGYPEYRMGNHAQATHAFAACVEQAELTNDSFYLDAARIAQARCLVLNGRTRLAADVIAAAAPDSATWLDGRFSRVTANISFQRPKNDAGGTICRLRNDVVATADRIKARPAAADVYWLILDLTHMVRLTACAPLRSKAGSVAVVLLSLRESQNPHCGAQGADPVPGLTPTFSGCCEAQSTFADF